MSMAGQDVGNTLFMGGLDQDLVLQKLEKIFFDFGILGREAGSATATPTGCGVLVSHPLGFVQVYPNGASACGRSEDTSGSTSIPVSSFAARRAPQGVGRRPWLSSASQVWNSAAKRLRRSRSSGTSNPSLSPIAAATSSSKLNRKSTRLNSSH